MNKHDVSQLPVLDRGRSVGSVDGGDTCSGSCARAGDALGLPIREVQDAAVPEVDAGADIELAFQHLQGGRQAVLVVARTASRAS